MMSPIVSTSQVSTSFSSLQTFLFIDKLSQSNQWTPTQSPGAYQSYQVERWKAALLKVHNDTPCYPNQRSRVLGTDSLLSAIRPEATLFVFSGGRQRRLLQRVLWNHVSVETSGCVVETNGTLTPATFINKTQGGPWFTTWPLCVSTSCLGGFSMSLRGRLMIGWHTETDNTGMVPKTCPSQRTMVLSHSTSTLTDGSFNASTFYSHHVI